MTGGCPGELRPGPNSTSRLILCFKMFQGLGRAGLDVHEKRQHWEANLILTMVLLIDRPLCSLINLEKAHSRCLEVKTPGNQQKHTMEL